MYIQIQKPIRHYAAVLACLGGIAVSGCNSTQSATTEAEAGSSSPANFSIDAQPVADIQPTMYGIFFEDINFAADGGLYAEMIKNRSFEFTLPTMGWLQPNSDRHSMNANSGFARVIDSGDPVANRHFLHVETHAATGYTLVNEGFRGMGVKQGAKYDLTLEARNLEGTPLTMKCQLVAEDGTVLGETILSANSTEWKEYAAEITASATDMKAQFRIAFEGVGMVDLDMISLFPRDTWMGRPKGLRKDLVQLLADLEPGFLRFPGGCIVEGRTLDRRYQWKKTVGEIEDREVLVNRWNTEFSHRPTPDYYQSFGIGFFEYFQLSEDLGAEPLPILSCGMACQFNSAELVPMEDLDPYIQDALDLIEFANGPTNKGWGKLRAEMGHPEPFNMKYIGVGNEQWGPEYIERYKAFDKAIRAEYPEMIIVSGSGPFPDGEHFDYAMEELNKMNVEIIDEHYYRNPEWFLENADRYDNYDRNGPKIFAGEYAAQSVAIASPDNKNNWECALSEAAFMTGLERNAEVVHLTSYAPLMAHAEGWQWTPDLIWFNNLNSYGTANYYVQKLYANNPGTQLVTLTDGEKPVTGQEGLYASATVDEESNELIIKVVNVSDQSRALNVTLKAGAQIGNAGTIEVLTHSDLSEVNSFDTPEAISPEKTTLELNGSLENVTLKPQSLSVIRVALIQNS